MSIIDNVCCPECKADLEKKENNFFCSRCGKKYEIAGNIPILVNLEKLSDHLAGQVKFFEKEYASGSDETLLDSWQKSYLERFEKNFSDVKNKIILDCGSGSGYMSIELAKRGAKVFACDLTLKGLKRLQKISAKHNLGIEMVCCSAQELPFKANAFDYFISNAVLEHLPEEGSAIFEINRVCRSGAGIMLTVPLSYHLLNPLFIPINRIHDKRIGHLRRYDEKKIKNKFRNWQIENIYYTGHTKKVLKTLFNMAFKIFDDSKTEKEDLKKEQLAIWASNMSCFMRKR